MNEIQIKWKDEKVNKYALNADNIHEIHPSVNCEYSPFIVKKSGTEFYIKAESSIKIINSGAHKVFHTKEDITIDASKNLDVGNLSAGADYYIYLCDEEDGNASFVVSANNSYPSGYTANSVRKIGGFHTLCVSVGAIPNHPLSGYVAADILPDSIWDLTHRPVSNPEGMVYSDKLNLWVDIYLPSGTGESTASVYGGIISTDRSWLDFVDDFAAVKKRMLTDIEFQVVAAGSNEETNIIGSSNPVTTGGHLDTNSRRMISDIGCEDMCGVVNQWLQDSSYRQPATPGWGLYELPGNKGSLYNYGGETGDADVKVLAGNDWTGGTSCGSRYRSMYRSRWDKTNIISGRGCAESIKSGGSSVELAPRWILTPTSFYVDPAGDDVTGDGSSAYPWATIHKAINYLNTHLLNAVVTINIAAGHYFGETIYIDPPNGYFIRLVGAPILTRNMTSLQSSSGSKGAWTHVLNLNDVSGISIGDFVAINVTGGGTNNATMYGYHEITNVDVINKRITVANKNFSTGTPSGAISADVYIFTTIIQVTNADNGILIRDKVNSILQNIGVVNLNMSSTPLGLSASSYGNDVGSGLMGSWVGVSGFYNGVRCAGPANFKATNIFVSNCIDGGFRVDNNGYFVCSGICISAGNANGIIAYHNGSMYLSNTIICGNSTRGAFIQGRGYLLGGTGNYYINNPIGVNADKGGYARVGGATMINNATSYSPAANTVGNNNSYINI